MRRSLEEVDMRDIRIYEWAFGTPWAIDPKKGEILLAVLEAHALGLDRATAHGAREAREWRAAARATSTPAPAFIGILPLHGVMISRGNFLNSSGTVSLEGARAIFRQMLADSSIKAILLDIDYPGGSVGGVEEFAGEIRNAAKPVVAQVWDIAASAAYWIGSSARELVVTPSGAVGSIGVYSAHWDASGFYEQRGLRKTYIQAGKFKTEWADNAPLSEEARSYEQGVVDGYYTRFVHAVAKGRKTSVDNVRDNFGQGRLVMSDQAVKLGMADRVCTFEETLARLSREISKNRSVAQASEDARRRAAQVAAEFAL